MIATLFNMPLKILARNAILVVNNLIYGTLSDYLSATFATLRAYIYDMVGDLDDIQVMLNDNYRITSIGELCQHFEQLSDIFKVQTCCRLVKDVEGSAGISF